MFREMEEEILLHHQLLRILFLSSISCAPKPTQISPLTNLHFIFLAPFLVCSLSWNQRYLYIYPEFIYLFIYFWSYIAIVSIKFDPCVFLSRNWCWYWAPCGLNCQSPIWSSKPNTSCNRKPLLLTLIYIYIYILY